MCFKQFGWLIPVSISEFIEDALKDSTVHVCIICRMIFFQIAFLIQIDELAVELLDWELGGQYGMGIVVFLIVCTQEVELFFFVEVCSW